MREGGNGDGDGDEELSLKLQRDGLAIRKLAQAQNLDPHSR